MNIKKLLATFDVRSLEASLYEQLLFSGGQSASELARRANLSRTSVYDLLERLLKIGLVTETLQGGVKKFFAQSPEKLKLLIEEKQTKLTEAKEAIEKLRQMFKEKQASTKPRLQLFEGRDELQQMMKDLLLYRDTTVCAYWPVKKMLRLLSSEFMAEFHEKRQKNNIVLQVIWPQSETPSSKEYPFLGTQAELKREARIAPKEMESAFGYSIYGRTVRFISSSKENFGFLVESPDLANMMQMQFDLLWKMSKSI